MGKKTRKNCKDIFTEEVFLDREIARATFWKCFDTVENDDDGNFQVIMYYGLGGMGKTSLLRQIEKEIDARKKKIIWEHYDFNDGQDPVVVLRKIAKNLQGRCHFEFHLFLYAVNRYLLMCGENPETSKIRNFLDSVPGARRFVKLMNSLPVAALLTTFLTSSENQFVHSFF